MSGPTADAYPRFGPPLACGCCAPTPWWSEPDAAAMMTRTHTRETPRLMNTFTKTKTPFVPLDGNRVGWYICGPTVYDSAHMGHARNYVNFDVLRRVVTEYFRYDVRFVMNVTDIDDKIVMRAHQRRSEEVLALAEKTLGASGLDAEPSAIALKALLASGEKKLGEQSALSAALAATVNAKARESDSSSGPVVDESWSIQDAYLTLAKRFEDEFMGDMASLNVMRPDALTRVSEYVDKIVSYIQRIVDRGFAYESNGSVYFDVPTFEKDANHKYAKLNKAALAEDEVEAAMDGEGALAADASEKKDAHDFVLWKASKPGEPSWASPWGEGRPGWHIECSAMCSDVLGEAVDINGGGIDLNFPHHENQLAQSEAFYDVKQWVNYFVHSGHLHIDGLKMSKSLKNFITIRAALKMYTARQLRFLFLLHQWSDPMDLTPAFGDAVDASGNAPCVGFKQMDAAVIAEKTFAEFFHAVKGVLRNSGPGGYDANRAQTWNENERALSDAVDVARAATHAAMIDNVNTPAVIKALKELVSATNAYLGKTAKEDVRPLIVSAAAQFVTTILSTLGVAEAGGGGAVGFGDVGGDAGGGDAGAGGGAGKEETLAPALDLIVKFRDEIRALAKSGADASALMAACDALRDDGLPTLGVKLDDRADGGALWKLYGVEELKKEAAREKEAKAKKAEELRVKKEEAARKLREKEEAAKIPPGEMFKVGEHAGTYSKYDDDGVPTHLADGAEVAKAQRKKLAKFQAAQKKEHEKYLAKCAADGVDAMKV
jgi:cysteinyl-tRNA synthetase